VFGTFSENGKSGHGGRVVVMSGGQRVERIECLSNEWL
jgi:hypothetical protein